MEKPKDGKFVGIASLFNADQLKTYFMAYIHFMVVVEIILFLIMFLASLGPGKGPFPIRFYFFLSFTVPIAITFLLGLFILAFNKYIFGKDNQEKTSESLDITEETAKNYNLKLNLFLHTLKKLPFLGAVFLVFVASVLVYKSDKIIMFIVSAGDKFITYILYGVGICLLGAMGYGITLIIANYKLRRSHMEFQYRYKNDVMERLELIVLGDDKVIDKTGKVVSESIGTAEAIESPDRDKLQILPPPR